MNKLIDKKDKIFISGHKGMVGSALVRKFKEMGYHNLVFASKEVLDLRDSNKVKNWFNENKPDITIIAAAKVGGILANDSYPYEFLLDNIKIQNNLIENSFENNVKRLLFLGSSCIYPKLAKQPIQEEELLSGTLEKTNEWYALAKISGIKLCDALRKQFDFDAISLMPTNLYGQNDYYDSDKSHVIPALIKKIHEAKINNLDQVVCWGSGEPKREFLYVDDLASACIFALEKWDPKSENAPRKNNNDVLSYLNVGTGIDIKIKSLVSLIAEKIGFNGEIKWDKDKPDGTPRKLLDVSRLNKLGWSPEITFQDGIDRTINFYYKELEDKVLRN